jgi:hypothetical protein
MLYENNTCTYLNPLEICVLKYIQNIIPPKIKRILS